MTVQLKFEGNCVLGAKVAGLSCSAKCLVDMGMRYVVSLKQIEYGFGHIITRSPYTPYFIYLRGTDYVEFGLRLTQA